MDLRIFSALNRIRCEESFHRVEDWSLNDWLTAVAGELGEAANILKKIKRGDFTLDEKRVDLAKEIADAATYLDLLAQAAGIDLTHALMAKFNEVSERVGSTTKIQQHGAIFTVSDAMFDGEHPNPRHFPGVTYDPEARTMNGYTGLNEPRNPCKVGDYVKVQESKMKVRCVRRG